MFIYVSTHCVEKVKRLDYNRYSQLTRWCSCNASALGARSPGFNPQLRQGFLYLIFCFVVVVFLLSLSKNTLFVTKVCYSFYNFKQFSIPKVLEGLLPTDLASLRVYMGKKLVFFLLRHGSWLLLKMFLLTNLFWMCYNVNTFILLLKTPTYLTHFQVSCIYVCYISLLNIIKFMVTLIYLLVLNLWWWGMKPWFLDIVSILFQIIVLSENLSFRCLVSMNPTAKTYWNK